MMPPNPDPAELKEVHQPIWQALLSVALGIAILIGSIVAYWQNMFPYTAFVFMLSSGIGLIFAGLGFQMSGKIKSINVAGGAGTGILIAMLWFQISPPDSQGENSVHGYLQGKFPEKINAISLESLGSSKILGAWILVNQTYQFRISEAELKGNCVALTTFYSKDNKQLSTATYIAGELFQEALLRNRNNSSAKHEEVFLTIQFQEDDPALAYIFKQGIDEPINYRQCGMLSDATDPQALEQQHFVGTSSSWVISSALAQTKTPSTLLATPQTKTTDENLAALLSSNSAIQREAIFALADQGSPSVAAMKSAKETLFSELDETEFYSHLTNLIFEILNRGSGSQAELRNELSAYDYDKIADVMLLDNRNTAINAELILSQLQDQRIVETLTQKGDELRSSDYDAVVREQRVLLDQPIPEMKPDEPKSVSPTQSGWVYLGTNFGSRWGEMTFDSQDKTSIPQTGDTLKAAMNINLRSDRIRFSFTSGWKNAPAIGLVKASEEFKIEKIEVVSGGYYWAQIEKVQN
ncbi:hypothetical protein IT893_12020 [Thalassospira sp. A40-3]|uniref:hypothetical protein n=1 Tax=Thalassospira sp. A40-3 TaxID=2785908 RepID=UPI0018CDCC38|nr:hypothetical protein [Thalassospira sp. A40-3]QPO10506.1 hypothetical protein IT893_12020 [Thalassospira sp. A40-3]